MRDVLNNDTVSCMVYLIILLAHLEQDNRGLNSQKHSKPAEMIIYSVHR